MRLITSIGGIMAAAACCLSVAGTAHADTPAPSTPLFVTASAATAGAAKKAAYTQFNVRADSCTALTDRTETNTNTGPGSWVYSITANCTLGDDLPTGDGWGEGGFIYDIYAGPAVGPTYYSTAIAKCHAIGDNALAHPRQYGYDDYRCVVHGEFPANGYYEASMYIWWHSSL